MRKVWGYCSNDRYTIGCNGTSVYICDKDDNELAVFKDAPYTYRAKFKPGTNVLAAKSTAGYLLFYDLDQLKLVKKIKTAKIGSQDDGFIFTPDGRYLYDIARPVISTRTALVIYDTTDYSVFKILFQENEKIVLKHLEFDADANTFFILGFKRNDEGVFDYGFIGKLKENAIVDVKKLDKEQYQYLNDYKAWEQFGFTEKKLQVTSRLKDMEHIEAVNIVDTYKELCADGGNAGKRSWFSKWFKR